MSAFNYQFKHIKSQVLFIILVVSSFFCISILLVNADECKNIQDLDDKAACYGEEKEEKEEEYESISKQLEDIRDQKNNITGQINNLASQISVTDEQISGIQNSINDVQDQLLIISENLNDRKTVLAEKTALRNSVIRNYYRKGKLTDLETFLGAAPIPAVAGVSVAADGTVLASEATSISGFQNAAFNYIFDKTLTEEALQIIAVLNTEIDSFESDKAEAESIKNELESEQNRMLAIKADLDAKRLAAEREAAALASQEGSYTSELASLSEEIAKLSSKQKEILNLKFGTENGTVGDYDSPKWTVPEPPFDNAFGAFSYGAYTHYRGMSQYGARGRANEGQDYKDIIEFYYDKDVKEKDDFPDRVVVDGHGELDFQYYLYGLAEMPSDWPMDALKAQAIAGRTYAYRFVKAGKSICTSQSCQVFLKSKADNPPSRWKEAVDKTKDEIIDGDTHAMYSSTTGGYIDDGIGWDGDWPGESYEKKGGSPWFYWAWYTQGTRFDSSSCGRGHPWLDEEEMADILNAWVVWRKGSGDEKSRISPVTTSCWGGNPYSLGDMADKADKYGEEYTDVSDVDVDIGNNGRTTKVTFKTNRGSVSIDGEEFKTVFNLRAPGYIAIKSRLYELKYED